MLVVEKGCGLRMPREQRRLGRLNRLALLRETLLPPIALLSHPGNAVSHLIAISPHPKERQYLKLISIAGARVLGHNWLYMDNNFSALGQIDWLVQDNASAMNFAPFRHLGYHILRRRDCINKWVREPKIVWLQILGS